MAPADQARPRRRPGPGRHKRFILGILGLGVAFLVFYYPLHWALNPWAVALPGKPALAGYWQGSVEFAPGDERRIVLHLVGEPPGRRSSSGIDGAAKVCGATQNTRYEIWGDPDNYSGTRFSLHSRRTSTGPGSFLNGLTGEWDGADLLTVAAQVTVVDADGGARYSASDPRPPLRFPLHRSTSEAFDAAC
jgi:hypothetical protein